MASSRSYTIEHIPIPQYPKNGNVGTQKQKYHYVLRLNGRVVDNFSRLKDARKAIDEDLY